jgi:hypothetical protein
MDNLDSDFDSIAFWQAACQGVAELAQKLGRHPLYAEYLSPYVTMLLQVSNPSSLVAYVFNFP